MTSNVGSRFDRLPATAEDRAVEGRPTRAAVIDFFADRFGIPRLRLTPFSYWEKGAGKIWMLAGDLAGPLSVEALGMTCLRTRQEHWKPTTDAVQRVGRWATDNVITLDGPAAARFVAGEDQPVEWAGDWGYLIVATELAGEREPLGVGLYVHGELQSKIPKGRQRSLDPV